MDALIFVGVILFIFATQWCYVHTTTPAQRKRDHEESHGIKVHL
jgi:hypothetical protein